MNEDFLFYRSLSQASRRSIDEFCKTVYSNEDIVQQVDYEINSHGYRSSEFNKNNEILVLGCSHTYGSGMPNEFTWPEIFSNYLNKKYSRLAAPGDSIGAQVYKAFKYFEEIGNPEIIVATFPLLRLEFISIPGKFLAKARSGNTELEKTTVSISYFYKDNLLNFSKLPHDPEYIIPREFVIFYNFMFIKMLEQYCESHNIKFIWSIYDSEDKEVQLQLLPETLRNYIKTSDFMRDCSTSSQKEYCEKFLQHKLYNFAADYDKKKRIGHWGIHIHEHMARLFIDRYLEIKND
jgi:hypothetical protein